MTDLRDDLRALGRELDWPPTPDLAATVRDRLPTTGSDPLRRRRSGGLTPWWRRRLIAGVALVALLLPATALAIPAGRHAILDALGLRHVAVERRATPPRATSDPRLGTRLATVAPDTLVPAALGAPAAAYRLGDTTTLVYDHPRLLLAQARGALPGTLMLRKIIAIDDHARRTTVGGRPAVFLADPHSYRWTDATGPVVRSGPALVWERGDRVLRLEGEPDLVRARAIAASVR